MVAASKQGDLVVFRFRDGSLTVEQSLHMPAEITAMSTMRIDPNKLNEQVFVALKGGEVRMYDSVDGILTQVGTSQAAGNVATLAFDEVDGDGIRDAVVVAGGALQVLPGFEMLDRIHTPDTSASVLDTIPTDYEVAYCLVKAISFCIDLTHPSTDKVQLLNR